MVTVEIDGKEIQFEVPATYKWSDPAYGERKRPIIATPDIAFVEGEEILIAKIGEHKRIRRSVHCFDETMNVKIQVSIPEGWKASQQEFELKFSRKHEEQIIEFEVWPEKGAQAGDIEFNCGTSCGQVNRWQEITYDHIPTQSLIKKAVITCRALDVNISEGKIAFINGVEDGIPAAIERLGFQVDRFDVSELAEVDLSPYNSVVLGIRVYNIHPELRNLDDKLFKYVADGGNVVMQYNTASRALSEMEFGPQPFSLSRNRVTEEDAEVNFELPKHRVLNSPNEITKTDFENWVQERGLYFAGKWHEDYETPLSWHDTGEEAQKGALIICRHEKGQFIYTGISFFRELPKGVVGAYRLFANILSYSNG